MEDSRAGNKAWPEASLIVIILLHKAKGNYNKKENNKSYTLPAIYTECQAPR